MFSQSANFDFLRANGVLMVIAFHVLAFFGIRKAGPFDLEAMAFAGFLFFFVHSSFVLMLSLERQTARRGSRNMFLTFMARRCFRIYPLSIVWVVVIAAASLPLASHPWAMEWPHPGRLDVLANIFLVQNLTGSPTLQGPLWSLPVEMQMYLILPALFLLVRAVRSVPVLLAGWGVATAFVFWRFDAGHAYLTKFLPCFMAGVIAYAVTKRSSRCWPAFGWPIFLWVWIALFTVVHRFEFGWIVCLAVALAAPRFVDLKSTLLVRPTRFFAKYSYGFYLSHYFCIWLAFRKLHALPPGAQWSLFFLVLFALPVLEYHCIEAPFINLGTRMLQPGGKAARQTTAAAVTSVSPQAADALPASAVLGSPVPVIASASVSFANRPYGLAPENSSTTL